jgi:hypothetical protein
VSKTKGPQLVPKPCDTAEEQVALWDAGEIIFSIEVGGLGPPYEQVIQIAAVEFTRAGLQHPGRSQEQFKGICEAALKRFDELVGGLTGAQFGAAVWLAWRWIEVGPKLALAAMKSVRNDRWIQTCRNMPQAPEPPTEEPSYAI